MAFAWRLWLKTIGITVVLTSIFWIVLGGWLWHRHLNREQTALPVAAATSPASAASTTVAQPPAAVLKIPVAGVSAAQLSDNFTQPRGGGARAHEALDIMATEGTPVIAAAAGRIEKLFLSKAGGMTVYQRSPDGGTIYYYAHLSGYAPGLSEGMQLKPGDPLGTVGHSGDADAAAPHLHFAIWRTKPEARWWDQTTAIDPYPLLAGNRPPK